MTSGTRHIISEAALWLSIFFIALAAFFYLDDRIGAYLEQMTANQTENGTPSKPKETVDNQQTNSQQQQNTGNGRVVLQAGRSGHFEVNAYINDRSIKLLADTGATYVVLTYEDAMELGLTYNLEFTGRARTANGVSRVAPLLLETVEVGDISIDNVKAFVAEEGKMSTSLLGMSFIGRLESFAMSGRELILIE